MSPERQQEIRQDFLEWSGGYYPWEAREESILYLEVNVDSDEEQEVSDMFDAWELEMVQGP